MVVVRSEPGVVHARFGFLVLHPRVAPCLGATLIATTAAFPNIDFTERSVAAIKLLASDIGLMDDTAFARLMSSSMQRAKK